MIEVISFTNRDHIGTIEVLIYSIILSDIKNNAIEKKTKKGSLFCILESWHNFLSQIHISCFKIHRVQ